MPHIKDIRFIPLITIPFILYLLVFDEHYRETIFSLSIISMGVIVFRFSNFKSIGIILMLAGAILIIFLDKDYKNSRRLGFIKRKISPFFVKAYDKVFSPFNSYKKLCYIVQKLFAVFWLLTLILLLKAMSNTIVGFILLSLIPVGTFLIIFYLLEKEKKFINLN